MTGHIRRDAQGPHAGSGTSAFLRFKSISEPWIRLRFHRQVYLTARSIERRTFSKLSINAFGRRNRVRRSERFLDFLVVQQQCHRFSNWPVLRNGMRPPARNISRRKSGAGEPFSVLPEVRFVTIPLAISTRSRSPVCTK